MDITRKFIQMGRTRSLRYALRKGGRKYEHLQNPPDEGDEKGKRKRTPADEDAERADGTGDTDEKGHAEKRGDRKEIPRTGEVYDESKLKGANIFEGYLDRCWADEKYAKAWADWREAGKRKEESAGDKDEANGTTASTTTKPSTTTMKTRRS